MSASAETAIGIFLKTVDETKKQNDSSQSDQYNKFVQYLENEIIHYFQSHDNSIKEAFVDLLDSIYKIKILTTDFFIKNPEIRELKKEPFINDLIIEVFDNKVIKDADLNNSMIKTLEFVRDKNVLNLYDLVSKGEFDKVFGEAIKSENILSTQNLFQQINNNLSELEKPAQERFKDFMFSSLSIDFVSVLYYLNEEKKLHFETQKFKELVSFNEIAIQKYNEDYPVFLEHIKGLNYLFPKLQELAVYLDKFILSQEIDEQTINSLKKAVAGVYLLKDLEPGWDDEDSTRINYDHILEGLKIIGDIFVKYMKTPTFTAPTAYSGVLLEYKIGNSRLDIRIGDLSYPIINYFVDGKLTIKRQPYDLNFLDSIWKKGQMI